MIHLLTLFLFISSSLATTSIEYYVTPVQTCTTSCTGLVSQPFDNLLIALNAARSYDYATINLLNVGGYSHYVLHKELDSSGNTLYDLTSDSSFGTAGSGSFSGLRLLTLGNVTVKPLFCDEYAGIYYFPSQCFQRTQQATLYFKTSKVPLYIRGTVLFNSITFDGTEDVQIWNTNSASPSTVNNCIYKRTTCCTAKTVTPNSGTSYMICAPNYVDYSSLSLNQQTGLFLFGSANSGGLTVPSLTFTSCPINNFVNPGLNSFIMAQSYAYQISFSGAQIDNNYFYKGFIYQSGDSPTATNTSSITFQSMTFSNYNYFNLVNTATSRSEAYLFYAPVYYSGVVQLIASTFTTSTTSVRTQCRDLTSSAYSAPLNNMLTSSPRSRSDLWNQYHKDHLNQPYMSSLIYIKSIYGAVSLTSSTFQNIIGTSGSVLRVDNTVNSNTWITAFNSIFDNNFAYDGFSNILIVQSTYTTFSRILASARIEVVGSQFTNAYGCPGSYGNVMFLSYWDSTPPLSKTALSSYDTGSTANSDYFGVTVTVNDMTEFLTATGDQYSYIRVRNSVFTGNQMSISNSLAIVGGYFTILQGNTFQNNGGTTGDIITQRLASSSFVTRYPAQTPTTSTTHFGQSTAVYFDRIIKLKSIGNQFDANWGPWEGSLSLATSLTIKNWIRTPNSISFAEDQFINHQGVPSSLDIVSPLVAPLDDIYNAPLVTISYDETGSNTLATSAYKSNIIMDNVKFDNNKAVYNYKGYTYNSAELSSLIKNTLTGRRRYSAGLIKFLLNFEALDIATSSFALDKAISDSLRPGFSFINGQITTNMLETDGCLFLTSWIESFVLQNSIISENEIYPTAPTFVQSSSNTAPALSQVMNSQHGLFCLSALDTLESSTAIQLSAQNLMISNNTGVIFNLYPSSSSNLYIENSILTDNINTHSSMISVYDSNQITSINNVFTSNTNPLGTVFAVSQAQYIGLFNTYLKNLGVHASLLLLSSTTQPSYELNSTIQWNDVSPTYKLFSGNLAPQGALYFLSSASLDIVASYFLQNYAYSGLISSSASSNSLIQCSIVDHEISGVSIVGNFLFMSDLTLTNTNIINSTLTSSSSVPVAQVSFIKLLTANLEVNGLTVTNGVASSKASFLFGNTITGTINDISFSNLQRAGGSKNALIELVASTVTMNTMTCNKITNLFSVMSTTLTLNTITIRNLLQVSNSQFLIEMSGTTLQINNIQFFGNGNYGNQFPLFGGDNNVLQITNSNFYNPTGAANKLFDLKNSDSVLVTNTDFIYSTSLDQTTIFDLASTGPLFISNCVFSRAGEILSASEARGDLYFTSNVIYSSDNVETLVIQNGLNSYIIDNTIIMPVPATSRSLEKNPIQIPDSQGTIAFNNNLILSLIGVNGILQVTSETAPYDLEMENNIFVNNIACTGGAIYLSVNKLWDGDSDPSASITNSIFLLNSAINYRQTNGRGGALYLTSPGETPQATILDKNYFINNTADTSGGAIYFDYTPPEMSSSSKFLKNFAARINHIASYPVRLVQLDLDNPINITYVPTDTAPTFTKTAGSYAWADMPSGPTSNYTYIFAVLDMYDQVVYDDDSSVLNIYNTEFPGTLRTLFANLLTLQATDGLYNYTGYSFTYRVGETTTATFISSAVQTFDTIPISGLVMLPSVSVAITFRKCKLGEFKVPEDYNLNVCHDCEASFWQTVADSAESSCQACGDSTTICLGGDNVGPKPGYWRLNKTSDIVISCPIDGACLGNEISGSAVSPVLSPTGTCADGYQGNLCNNCIEGYGKSSDGNCTSCDTDHWHYILFGIMFIVQVYLLSQGVKETMELAEDFADSDTINTNTAVLLRILVNYFQLISVIGGIPIAWPNFMQNTVNVNSKLGSFTDQLLAIDCFVRGDANSVSKYLIFLKIAVVAFGPFFLIIVSYLFWALYFTYKKRPIRGNRDFINKFVTTVVVICFNMQPVSIQTSFELFQCINLYREDSPLYFMIQDYDIKCWEGAHLKWTLGLGIPSLLLWIVIVPAFMFRILRKNKDRLREEKIAKKYAFLYIGYKKEKYFWEFVIMSRKILLIFGTVLGVIYSNDFELYFSVLLTIVAYVLQVWNNPYETKQLNLLESISLLSSEIVCFCALYFKLINRRKELDIIMVIFGFVGNLFFCIAFLREFIKVKLKDLRRNKLALKILNFVRLRICCCYKDSPLWKKLGVGNASAGFAAHFIGQMQLVNVNSDDAGEGEAASSSEGRRTAKKEVEGTPDLLSPTNQQLLISFPGDTVKDEGASPSIRLKSANELEKFGSLTGKTLMTPKGNHHRDVSRYLAAIEEDSLIKSPVNIKSPGAASSKYLMDDDSFGKSPTKNKIAINLSKCLDEDNFGKSPVNKPPSKHVIDDEDSFTKAPPKKQASTLQNYPEESSPRSPGKNKVTKPPNESYEDKSPMNKPDTAAASKILLDVDPLTKTPPRSQVSSWLKFPDEDTLAKSPQNKGLRPTSKLFLNEDASPKAPLKKQVTLKPPNESYEEKSPMNKADATTPYLIDEDSFLNSPQKKPVINLSKTPVADDTFAKSPITKQVTTKPPKDSDEDFFTQAQKKPTINLPKYPDEDTLAKSPLNKSPTDNISKYFAQIGDNSFGESPMNRSPIATRDRLEPGTPFGVNTDKQKLAFSLGDVLNEVQYEESSMSRDPTSINKVDQSPESKKDEKLDSPQCKKDDDLEKEIEQIISEPPSGVNEFDSERKEIELHGQKP